MARIVLGVTGSVAALRTPQLRQTLRDAGHSVRVVTTDSALSFFDPAEIGPPEPEDEPRGSSLFRDADEWSNAAWTRGDPVLHIELRRWADLLLIAPLDANTLGKIALGLSDNCLTCLVRAWDFESPLVLAPAMNSLMWLSPVTVRHFKMLFADHSQDDPQLPWTLDDLAERFEQSVPAISVIPPISKQLACGDEGVGAMAEVPTVVASVDRCLQKRGIG